MKILDLGAQYHRFGVLHIIDSVGDYKTLPPALVISFEQANISENEFVDNAL